MRSLAAWLEVAGITAGPLFRGITRHQAIGDQLTDRAVALIVKRAARLVGIAPSRLAGHSLRSGLATAAAMAGKSERAIMAQTGHRGEKTVRKYIRAAGLFSENAAVGIL